MVKFNIVAAVDSNFGMGKNGALPWPKLKGDIRFYKELTTCPDTAAVEFNYGYGAGNTGRSFDTYQGFDKYYESNNVILEPPNPSFPNVVIMGRRTWESLPERFRPLPNRINIVLTRSGGVCGARNVVTSDSLDNALESLEKTTVPIFVIGGSQIYELAINHPNCQKLYLTSIAKEFDCDTHFPEHKKYCRAKKSGHRIQENGIEYGFSILYTASGTISGLM